MKKTKQQEIDSIRKLLSLSTKRRNLELQLHARVLNGKDALINKYANEANEAHKNFNDLKHSYEVGDVYGRKFTRFENDAAKKNAKLEDDNRRYKSVIDALLLQLSANRLKPAA